MGLQFHLQAVLTVFSNDGIVKFFYGKGSGFSTIDRCCLMIGAFLYRGTCHAMA